MVQRHANVPPNKWHWTEEPVNDRMGRNLLTAACGRTVPSVRVLRTRFGGRPIQWRCKRCQSKYVDYRLATGLWR